MPTYSTTSLDSFTIGSADISTATASSSTTTSASIRSDPYYYPTTTTTTSPYINTSSTISSPSVTLYVKDYEKECKEMCDKVDQHVDQLEEDIQFLADKYEEEKKVREEHEEQMAKGTNDAIIALKKKIADLDNQINNLKNYTEWLESRINKNCEEQI